MPDLKQSNLDLTFSEAQLRNESSTYSGWLQIAKGTEFTDLFPRVSQDQLEFECRRRLNEFFGVYNEKDKAIFDELFVLMAKAGRPELGGSKEEFNFYKDILRIRFDQAVNNFYKNQSSFKAQTDQFLAGQDPKHAMTFEERVAQLYVIMQYYSNKVGSDPKLQTMDQQLSDEAAKSFKIFVTAVSGPLGDVAKGAAVAANAANKLAAVHSLKEKAGNLREAVNAEKKKSAWELGGDWIKEKLNTALDWAKKNPVKATFASIVAIPALIVGALFYPIVRPIVGGLVGVGELGMQANENLDKYNKFLARIDRVEPINEYLADPKDAVKKQRAMEFRTVDSTEQEERDLQTKLMLRQSTSVMLRSQSVSQSPVTPDPSHKHRVAVKKEANEPHEATKSQENEQDSTHRNRLG